MTTKKTTKVTKKATKKAAVNEVKYTWVLSERSKLLFWNPVEVIDSYDAAVTRRNQLEADSIYGVNGYKLNRVVVRK